MDDNLSIIEEELEQLEVSTDSDSGVDSVEIQDKKVSRLGNKPSVSRIPLKTAIKPPTPERKGTSLPQGRSRQKMVADIMNSTKLSRSHSVPASSRPPFTSFSTTPSTPGAVKKVSMNKIVVGVSPSPNLRKTSSKIGSLTNSSHRPGGGQVKIENRKLEWNVNAKTVNLNSNYAPGGGDKKIEQRKLSWNVTSKVGSLEKANYTPGGGQVKIENRRLEWNVNSRVGSTKNINHRPGGGNIQIHNEKVEINVGSRIGSLANVKHKPGGGDKKIFDDKEYARQMNELGGLTRSGSSSLTGSTWDTSNPNVTSMATLPRSKRSVTSSGTSFQSQIVRKLSPMSTGF